MAMRINTAKQKMLRGEVSYGYALGLGSIGAAEAMAHCGLDPIPLDRQHGSWGEGPPHARGPRPGPRPATDRRGVFFVDRHDPPLRARVARTTQDERQVIELVLDGLQEGGRPEKESKHE